MKEKALTVLCALMGLGMVVFGFNKLVPFMQPGDMSEQQKALFGAMATLKWLFPLIGIGEIVGGLLIAIPKTRALGAMVLFPLCVGIVIHHLVHDPATVVAGLVFFAINIWAIIDNKDKYMPMIK